MIGPSSALIDKLSSLASSELFLYKGMLSVTRLIAINIKNGAADNSDALYDKQKSYMNEIDKLHAEYISSANEINDNALKSVLFLKAPIPSDGFYEYVQLFSVLRKLRTTIDAIVERNNYAIEQTSTLSKECMEKIKALNRQKAFYAKYVNQGAITGNIYNFQEKEQFK